MTMLNFKHSIETKAKMRTSAIARGDCGGAKKLVGLKRPQEVIEKLKPTMFEKGHLTWNKGIHHIAVQGNKHPMWKGGISKIHKTERQIEMNTLEYKIWRRSVFQRDNYTCQSCGAKSQKGKKVYLHADHIERWIDRPDLRLAIDNGQTLCDICHYEKHKNK